MKTDRSILGLQMRVFYEFDEDGKEAARRSYPYPSSYVHDFQIVTENYYVLFDCRLIKIDFKKTFTDYLTQNACLSELICEDTERQPLFSNLPEAWDRYDGPNGLRGLAACFTRTTT